MRSNKVINIISSLYKIEQELFKLYMSEILVLNNSYMPIAKTNEERAICLLILEKAFSIKDSPDKEIRSQYMTMKIPEIIVLKNVSYIRRHVLGYSKRAIFKRDNHCCQMCGETRREILSLEHLIPKSRWEKVSKERDLIYNRDSFENCACLCKPCNAWKSDRLPEEIGWEFVARAPLTDFDIDWNELFS